MSQNPRLARIGHLAFFFSGICAISSGIIVNLLQERYGFSYAMTGTLLSTMSIGNMAATFISGILPGKIGNRNTVAFLCFGYCLGYLMMALFGAPGLLLTAFALVGIAKGCTINNCTVLVGNNSPNRTKGMSLMHACYATGAMLCPFVISLLSGINRTLPMLGISSLGLMLWLTFMTAGLPNERRQREKSGATDYAFLKSGFFWLLTALIFCQNGAETAVSGWLVTYYKSTGILSGTLSTYTVTIMWGATLIGRLFIAFVFHIKDSFKILGFMGIGCVLAYLGLVAAGQPVMAIFMLFLFALSMAGVNPVGMAGIGKMMNSASVGILLTLSSLGQIVMPWIIGIAADSLGLQTAMALNLIPCTGIAVLSFVIRATQKKVQ